MGFILPKLSGQEGAQGKLEEVFDFYESLFSACIHRSAFTLQQIKGNWRCEKTVLMDAATALDVFDKSMYPIFHSFLQNLAMKRVSTALAERCIF